MYKKISCLIADSLLKSNILSDDKYPLFKYGCELVISNIIYTLIFIIISILTNTFLCSLLFYIGFLITRNFCGGYHASSYIRCHLLFAFNHLLFITFTYLFPSNFYLIFLAIAGVLCSFCIACYSPVDHKNKQFTKGEYYFFRKCSIVISIVIALCTVVFIVFSSANMYAVSMMFGISSAAISMLVAKLQRKNCSKYK